MVHDEACRDAGGVRGMVQDASEAEMSSHPEERSDEGPALSRRDFVRKVGVGALVGSPLATACRTAARVGSPPPSRGWDAVPDILIRIAPPTFPSRDFEITKFDAVGDGEMNCTVAIRRAIDACSS